MTPLNIRHQIAADADLNPIYLGSIVEHIEDKWEGEVVGKSTGDAVKVKYRLTSDDHEGIIYDVVVDELRVVPPRNT